MPELSSLAAPARAHAPLAPLTAAAEPLPSGSSPSAAVITVARHPSSSAAVATVGFPPLLRSAAPRRAAVICRFLTVGFPPLSPPSFPPPLAGNRERPPSPLLPRLAVDLPPPSSTMVPKPLSDVLVLVFRFAVVERLHLLGAVTAEPNSFLPLDACPPRPPSPLHRAHFTPSPLRPVLDQSLPLWPPSPLPASSAPTELQRPWLASGPDLARGSSPDLIFRSAQCWQCQLLQSALALFCWHLDKTLEDQYVNIHDPQMLWAERKARFNDQSTVFLPKGPRRDWANPLSQSSRPWQKLRMNFSIYTYVSHYQKEYQIKLLII
ncbi:MAG: hypothetical protein BJ554DRAFT_4956 [Olpidium bornovanus]|uniref:Uncharacterized protein n=1 Tax=Olpidium bornovanus TaxID=278681 RepID=A0A8H8DEV9_9FUNG|nr:MAG: hypothetical protein BJ554DRAFT_4956 [Olpidium bornovanus]